MSNFTDRLEACYKAKNYDRKHFAAEIGVPESTIRNWSHYGNIPPADLLFKISKFFGVPMEYFLDGSDTPLSDQEIGLLIKMKKLNKEQWKMLASVVDNFVRENEQE